MPGGAVTAFCRTHWRPGVGWPLVLPFLQVDECQVKLQRADKLIGGLGGERSRWEATVAQLDQDLVNVVGDVVVASGKWGMVPGGGGGGGRSCEGGMSGRGAASQLPALQWSLHHCTHTGDGSAHLTARIHTASSVHNP